MTEILKFKKFLKLYSDINTKLIKKENLEQNIAQKTTGNN